MYVILFVFESLVVVLVLRLKFVVVLYESAIDFVGC